METKRQCPNCGKYVAADKTYCMNCGTTLGIKCEGCGQVVPLGEKTCPACGYSFVKKAKRTRAKVKRESPLWKGIRRHVRMVITVTVAVTLLAVAVMAAFPALSFSLTDPAKREPVATVYEASGYGLAVYFLGIHLAGVDALLSLKLMKDVTAPVNLCLYGEGLGLLCLLVSLLLACLLAVCNLRSMAKATSRRMLILLAVALGGAALMATCGMISDSLLYGAALAAYPAADGTSALPFAVGGLPVLIPAILSAVAFLIHLCLHLTVLRRAEPTEKTEVTLRRILVFPWLQIKRFFRFIFRRGEPGADDERTVVCTKSFTSYLIVTLVALVFTQALQSKVSHIFFWFMLLLPAPLLLYTLAAIRGLTVELLSGTVTTEKHSAYTYEFRICNRTPLAFPFIDATVTIPQANSVRCTDRSVRLSMAPLSHYHIKNTVTFRFRGTYDIGVRHFYVYDFFRMFRVRVPVDAVSTVYVLPRRHTLDDTLAQAISDSTARTVRSPLVVDKLEVSDIRDYQSGDPLKSIHWKLSSKSETFVVKDYNTGTSNRTAVFCDLSAHFPDEAPKKALSPEETEAVTAAEATAEAGDTPKADRKNRGKKVNSTKKNRQGKGTSKDAPTAPVTRMPEAPVDVHEPADPAYYEDMNEYLADGVVELTIANVLAELQQGHEVLLAWFDRRSDNGLFAYSLRGIDQFESVYHLFATAPVCPRDKRVAHLTATVTDAQSTKHLFVIPSLDQEALSDLMCLPGITDAGNFGSAEVILYNPEDRFRHPKERASYLEGCREQLATSGLSLHTGNLSATREEGGDRREA